MLGSAELARQLGFISEDGQLLNPSSSPQSHPHLARYAKLAAGLIPTDLPSCTRIGPDEPWYNNGEQLENRAEALRGHSKALASTPSALSRRIYQIAEQERCAVTQGGMPAPPPIHPPPSPPGFTPALVNPAGGVNPTEMRLSALRRELQSFANSVETLEVSTSAAMKAHQWLPEHNPGPHGGLTPPQSFALGAQMLRCATPSGWS